MPQLQRRSFLAIWLRFAADCLYLAVYFATKFFLDVTEGVSISSALAFQFVIAAALVASAVLISPTAAGSSLSKGIARKYELRGRIGCTHRLLQRQSKLAWQIIMPPLYSIREEPST